MNRSISLITGGKKNVFTVCLLQGKFFFCDLLRLLNFYLLPFAFCLFCFTTQTPCRAQETTWESPSVSIQLDMDNTIIPVGKGAVFCAAMTIPDYEPMYGVLKNGRVEIAAKMGHRIVLSPGVYDVVYGSGTVDQMLKKRVKVVEGATTVLKTDWSGLIIEVTNKSRANIREYYELYDLVSGNSYGMGQGVEEGLDEELKTWILPPGVYKIVKPGNNVNAVTNFGTIRLLRGELVRTSLVLDSESGDFLGFGHMANVRQLLNRENKWRTRSELAGSALLNYIPSSGSGTEKDARFTGTFQWISDIRYESGRHVIPIWSNMEEGLSMQSNSELQKYIDLAELRLTYIYRLSNIFSPYIRAFAETRLFKTQHRFEDRSDYVRVDSKGETLEVVKNAETIELGGSFSPVYLKQGFGITSILIKSLPVNFNVRGGYGARQTYTRDASIFNTETNILSPMTKSKITGVECLLFGDIRIGRYVLFYTEFDILMPDSKRDTWVYDGENRLRLNLTSNVNLLFKVEYWKYENVSDIQTRYQTLLRFSKYL
ncbi:MAG: hypothetical protein HOC71_05475 [Candidatus Latescibacteria bacterium]|nr:hypothetical protein [Candidatus Latescibacterota bacterium]